jgi:hypothetical protein
VQIFYVDTLADKRVFAPRIGINEDPVTGSAPLCLGLFRGNRLRKAELVAYQVSHRGGTVHLRVKGKRVCLSGKAMTVLSDELSDARGECMTPNAPDEDLGGCAEGVIRARSSESVSAA